ncbi:BZ3500_MvSof-1268-A1-R1_Chr2-2g04735 [Microbotryum saponariae]|uniref:BZ3500_MvSof-1268-A1-R1_Chr2-2g04735 protein n=1 Tax=Microbotryum saponariae TaxID=289078 RepID=A0A2X0N491_9BASI|nr:BZ3500_MvSof-1268-A1-R1_Chr2-2g04735 [Microbotryum saponariae]SDA00036.1 BZ3501_MvSof-1269-A2-R1_Chr2-2g04409 [Microbotryum saponariae]
MSLFGQLLTHPSRVTFPWSALRHALNLYFASPPHLLDPAKIGSGWNGLSLILTSFKRLEVVQSTDETEEVLLWLTNLKSAAPVTEEEMAIGRARYTLVEKLPSALSIQLITFSLLCRSQTHSSKPIGSASTATSIAYDPFALEDLSNAAPRKRSVEISIETGASHKKSRPSASTPSVGIENDAADYEVAEADRKRTKVAVPPVTNSRRPVPAASSSRRGSATATLDSKPTPAAARPAAEAVPASASPIAALSTSRPKKTAAPAKAVAVPESVDASPAVKKVTRIQRPHDPNRPNFSYSALIGQAILTAPLKRLRLSEIYDFVTNNYSYYKKNECGWQNSIRHNLSLQPVFKKIPDNTIPGKKGCFWTIIPSEEWRFADGGWTKLEKGSPAAAVHQHKKGKKTSTDSSPSGAGAAAAASPKEMVVGAGAEALDDEEDDDDDDDEGDGAMYTEDDD